MTCFRETVGKMEGLQSRRVSIEIQLAMDFAWDILRIYRKENGMVTKVQRWGNSQGLRFSKEVLEEAQIAVGDEVSVSVRGRRIIVEPTTKVRGRYSLQELVAKIPKSYRVEEVKWGEPVGKEAW
jgi:antitoxin MazE